MSGTIERRDIHLVLTGVMVAIFLGALDQMIVTTALPSIAADLGDVTLVSWVVTANLITSIGSMAVAGKLSDVYGRRPMLIAVLAIFCLASIACALATSMLALIVARTVQGLGGGALVTLAQTLAADVISPRERGKYSAWFSLMWALASLVGPTLGGFLTQHVGWEAIFWINLPMGLAALITIDRVLRKLTYPRQERSIDFVSVGMLPIASAAMIFALSWGGIRFPWLSLPVIAMALVAIVTYVAFFRRQKAIGDPLMPPHFWSDNVVGRVLPAMLLVFGAYLALCVTVPIFLQTVHALRPADVGLAMIPLTFATTLSAFLCGRHINRTGDYRLPPVVSLPIGVVGLLALAIFAPRLDVLGTTICLAIAGVGVGAIFPASIVAAQNAVAIRDIGAVTGALGFMRSLGGAVFAAAAASLVLALIAGSLPPGESLRALDELVRRALTPTERGAILTAYQWLFAVIALLLAGGATICSLVALRPLRDKAALAERKSDRP
jgi:EmrB/QacA subfamily drug resistance transporter